MAKFEYELEVENGEMSVALKGSLDASSSAPFFSDVDKAFQDGAVKNAIWDVSGLTTMASSGLRVVMITTKYTMTRGGAFRIVNANPNLRSLFKMAGMDKFLILVDSPAP